MNNTPNTAPNTALPNPVVESISLSLSQSQRHEDFLVDRLNVYQRQLAAVMADIERADTDLARTQANTRAFQAFLKEQP